MAMAITINDLITHLRKHYDDESLVVVDIWSSDDVERWLTDLDLDETEADRVIDKSMDIWADIAETFASEFEYTTSQLNDELSRLVDESL